MKAQAFRIFRYVFRFVYSLPKRVRPLWRTLLGWCCLARIFFRGGMAAVELRRNSVRGINKSPSPFPPYRG